MPYVAEANRKRIYDSEYRKRLSIQRKKEFAAGLHKRDYIFSEESKKKMSESHKGPKAYNWKGGYENRVYHVKKRRITKLGATGSHTQEEWVNLKEEFDFICICCGLEESETTLSEDHVIPLSKGGTDDISNIQPLCRSCNSKKGTKIIDYRVAYKLS